MDELVSAVLLFQLMQCLEVQIEPDDDITRSLLRDVVRAAADGPAGWARIDVALRECLTTFQRSTASAFPPALHPLSHFYLLCSRL